MMMHSPATLCPTLTPLDAARLAKPLLPYPAVDLTTGQAVDRPDAYTGATEGRYRPNRAMRAIYEALATPTLDSVARDAAIEGALTCAFSAEMCVDPVLVETGTTVSWEQLTTYWRGSLQHHHLVHAADTEMWLGAEVALAAAAPVAWQPPSLFSPNCPMANAQVVPNLAMRAFMEDLGLRLVHGPEHAYAPPSLTADVAPPVRPAGGRLSLLPQYQDMEARLADLCDRMQTKHGLLQRARQACTGISLRRRTQGLIAAAPEAIKSRLLAIDLALALGRLDEARTQINASLPLDPEHRQLRARAALAQASRGDWDLAEVTCAAIRQSSPRWSEQDWPELLAEQSMPWALYAAYGAVRAHRGDPTAKAYLRCAQALFPTRTVAAWLGAGPATEARQRAWSA